MKKNIIAISILALIFINLAGAVSFSPSSLTFNLEPNQQTCQIIYFDSTSEIISASDSWAENKNIEWKVSNFETSASSLGISINYPPQVSSDKKQIEICLSGKNEGEYHGVLLLKEEQQGNSIIQMGIWLKVLIGETPQTPSEKANSGTTSTTSASNSNITAKIVTKNTEQTPVNQVENTAKTKSNSNTITGGVIGTIKKFNKTTLIFAGIILVVGLIIVYTKRKKEYEKNFGY